MTKLEEQVKIIALIKKELSEQSSYLFSLTISGSELYGFSSEDSDIDYRGIYIKNTNKLLGLGRPREVIEIDGEHDIVLNELRKEINLALKGNCNVLEHLSAKQIYTTPEFLVLKPILLSSYGKDGIYHSYKGMATYNYKKFIMSGRKNTVKKYLYVFRALCAGIHVLETQVIQPNILALNKYYKIPELKELIKIKIKGKEKEPLPTHLNKGQIEAQIIKLFERIDKAYLKSNLPEKSSLEDEKEIESWLIKMRKKYFD